MSYCTYDTVRDMWDRLTAPTPSVTLESTFRQPIRRFTVSRPPPFRLSFHPCFRVVLVVCVFVPCGILRAPWPSEWSRERSAPSSVARVCRRTRLRLEQMATHRHECRVSRRDHTVDKSSLAQERSHATLCQVINSSPRYIRHTPRTQL